MVWTKFVCVITWTSRWIWPSGLNPAIDSPLLSDSSLWTVTPRLVTELSVTWPRSVPGIPARAAGSAEWTLASLKKSRQKTCVHTTKSNTWVDTLHRPAFATLEDIWDDKVNQEPGQYQARLGKHDT